MDAADPVHLLVHLFGNEGCNSTQRAGRCPRRSWANAIPRYPLNRPARTLNVEMLACGAQRAQGGPSEVGASPSRASRCVPWGDLRAAQEESYRPRVVDNDGRQKLTLGTGRIRWRWQADARNRGTFGFSRDRFADVRPGGIFRGMRWSATAREAPPGGVPSERTR